MIAALRVQLGGELVIVMRLLLHDGKVLLSEVGRNSLLKALIRLAQLHAGRCVVLPVRGLRQEIVSVLVHVVVLRDLGLARRDLLLVFRIVTRESFAHRTSVAYAVIVRMLFPLLIESSAFWSDVPQGSRLRVRLHFLRLDTTTLINGIHGIERIADSRCVDGWHGYLVVHHVVGRDGHDRQVREADRLLCQFLVAVWIHRGDITVFIYLDLIDPGFRTEI